MLMGMCIQMTVSEQNAKDCEAYKKQVEKYKKIMERQC